MPSNAELMEAMDRAKRFMRHEDCPKGIEPGAGLSGSPRQSDFGTAVILGPDDYHALLTIRDVLQSTLAPDQGEVEITRERVMALNLGFEPLGAGYLRLQLPTFNKNFEPVELSFDLLSPDEMFVSLRQDDDHVLLTTRPLKGMAQLLALLAALGIEVKR